MLARLLKSLVVVSFLSVVLPPAHGAAVELRSVEFPEKETIHVQAQDMNKRSMEGLTQNPTLHMTEAYRLNDAEDAGAKVWNGDFGTLGLMTTNAIIVLLYFKRKTWL